MMRFLALLVCLAMPLAAFADDLRAGAATIDITPPIGHPMWGYASRKDAPCKGVLDPLHARALVLGAGKETIALVSLDLGRAPTRESFERIRKKVAEKVAINELFLVASHTHHGPVLELDQWPDKKKPYVRDLEQKIADVIVKAAKAQVPARIGTASKEVALNRNRHAKEDPKPVDRELLVLRVEDAEGKVIAHAVNFAAHPTMIDSKTHKFSADYPGVLAGIVEKETKVPCLFLQGAAGDLSPNPGEHDGHEKFGKALAEQVLALAKRIRCELPKNANLATCSEEFKFKSRVDHADPLLQAGFRMAFYSALVDFYVKEYEKGVRPRLTVALLGDIGFVGVSGELFCEHSMNLKRRARVPHLFVFGYCNDYQQYFPTIQAAAEGGAGADAPLAPAEAGAGEAMMDKALVHLFKMRGKLKDLRRERKDD